MAKPTPNASPAPQQPTPATDDPKAARDQQRQKKRADKQAGHNFALSALGMIGVAIGLCVLSGAAAAGAVLLEHRIAFDGPNADQLDVIVSYALFAPATILLALSLAALVIGAVRWGVYGRSAKRPAGSRQIHELLQQMNQRLLFSETSKRIAHRHQDITALRRTIQQDIDQHHYDAALVFVHELGQTYGHVEEAEAFREKILSARTAETQARIDEAEKEIEQLIQQHEFEVARRAANRLQRLHPDSEHPHRLSHRVAAAREQYKHDLERQFLVAARREDVDQAMIMLKELDKYLTEREAEPFRETARGVIGKQRDNLGVQFKLAVQDKEWLRASSIGEQIIREFPNTKMADEVRSMLDLLRDRAAGERAAAAGGRDTPAAPA